MSFDKPLAIASDHAGPRVGTAVVAIKQEVLVGIVGLELGVDVASAILDVSLFPLGHDKLVVDIVIHVVHVALERAGAVSCCCSLMLKTVANRFP